METLDLGQVVPNIGVGTVTALDPTAKPTITKSTSSTNTDIKYDFGIPSPATFATPAFDDTTSAYTSLTESNTAAETASNAIVSGNNFFTMLSNMKKSFSAIIQGLKFLGTNVGAITGITSDLNGESETVAASIKAVNEVNTSLSDLTVYKKETYVPDDLFDQIIFNKIGSAVLMQFGKFARAFGNNEGTISIGVVPEGYRPRFAANFIIPATLNGVAMYIAINTSGKISVRTASAIVSGANSYTSVLYLS